MGMTPPLPHKLYAYVDESGQDTAGRLFVVSVLLLAEERDALLQRLEALEARSGKHNTKWQKTRHSYRQAYMEAIRDLPVLQQALFFDILQTTSDYMTLTALTTARAIQRKVHGPYKVTVFVDGLRRHEVPLFSKGLRRLWAGAGCGRATDVGTSDVDSTPTAGPGHQALKKKNPHG